MNWLQTQLTVLDACDTTVSFAANWLIQSTILILTGLVIGQCLRTWGSAVQSAVYRSTLAAVLVSPLITALLAINGLSGWSVQLPVAWTNHPSSSQVLSNADRSGRALDSNARRAASEDPWVPVAQAATQPRSTPSHDELNLPDLLTAAESGRVREQQQTDSLRTTQERAGLEAAWPRAFSIHALGWATVVLTSLWCVVSLLLVSALVRDWFCLKDLERRSVNADAATIGLCEELAAKLKVRNPRVLRSPYLQSPCLAGLAHPAILLPEAEGELSLRDVLIHELAHVRRRDCHWHLIRRMAQAIFFFQPFMPILARRMELAAEEVCDDFVVELGGNRERYAHKLVDVAELSTARRVPLALGIMSFRSALARRVARIVDTSRPLSTRVGHAIRTIVIVGGIAGSGAAGFLGLQPRPSHADTPPASSQTPAAAQTSTDQKTSEKFVAQYAGKVVDPAGQPVAGARLYLNYHIPEPNGPLLPTWKALATTDAAGNFHFSMRDQDFGPGAVSREWKAAMICAAAEGFGFGWRPATLCEKSGATLREMREKMNELPEPYQGRMKKLLSQVGQPIQLVADVPIQGQVVDIDGQPVAAARLTLLRGYLNADENLAGWIRATNAERADFYSAREEVSSVLVGPQIRSLVTPAVTDAKGRFKLSGVGPDRVVQLLVEGPRIQSEKIFVYSRPGAKIELSRSWRSPDLGNDVYYPADFVYVAGPSQIITGVVRDAASGDPLSGVTVKSQKRHGHPIIGLGQDFVRAVTDAEGRYRLVGMPVGSDNRIAAFSPVDQPYLAVSKQVKTHAGSEPLQVDFHLQKGVWVTGRVTDKQTGRGLPGRLQYFSFRDNPYLKSPELWSGVDGRDRFQSDEEGRFQITTLPGRGIVAFLADNHQEYPRGAGAGQIKGSSADLGAVYFRTVPYCMPMNFHIVAEVRPREEDHEFELHLEVDSGQNLVGQVVGPDGAPVPHCWYSGRLAQYATWSRAERDGSFTLTGYEPAQPRRVLFLDPQRQLSAQLILSGPASEPPRVTLQPSGTVRGKLVDEDGSALPEMQLVPWTPILSSPAAATAQTQGPQPTPIPLPPNNGNQSQYLTDEDGTFEIAGLAAEIEYRIRAFDLQSMTPARGRRPRISGVLEKRIKLQPGETIDLGNVRLKPSSP